MSEFIREVDEEYRQEQIRGLLSRYWVLIVALAVAVLIAVGGWRAYVYYTQQQAEAAGNQYFAATQLAHDDRAASLVALETLAKSGPAGYALLARFRAAMETGMGDPAAGAKAFDALAADQGVNNDLRDIARLRAALLIVNTADAAEITRRFEPLADANAAFRNLAREVLAVSALKQGDDATAKRWLEAEIADPTLVQDQRQRAGLFLSLVRAGRPGAVPAPLPSAPQPSPAPAAPAAEPPVTDQPPAAKP